MRISGAIPQLRTTDLGSSIRFYTEKVGLTLEFQYEDFYAGIRAGGQVFHLKLADQKVPSIAFVDRGGTFISTSRRTTPRTRPRCSGATRGDHRDGGARHALGHREFVIKDDQGHTLYFGQRPKTSSQVDRA